MKTIFALLLACALPAYGADHSVAIANMASQCRCVMEGGVCQVSNDPNPPRAGSRIFTSAGPISADVYNAFRAKGPLMCQEGIQVCTANWDSEACRAGFRLMFRQEPALCLPRK